MRIRRIGHVCCWALLTSALVPATLFAAENSTADEDREAIRNAAKQYVDALNRGDFAALGAMWTADGDYVDAAGHRRNARQMIQQMQQAAGERNGDARVLVGEIRFITPEVAIEDGVAETMGRDDDGDAIIGRFTAVWVKREGRWLLDGLRESTAETPSPSDRLAELDWLIGAWIGQAEGAVMLVSSEYSESGAFIVREFAVQTPEGQVMTGEQRIGWDPLTKGFKCWLFDSQGGYGEGTLQRDGDHWLAEMTEVLPDGHKSTVKSAYIPQQDGSIVWETGGAKVEGHEAPAVRVVFRRAPE